MIGIVVVEEGKYTEEKRKFERMLREVALRHGVVEDEALREMQRAIDLARAAAEWPLREGG